MPVMVLLSEFNDGIECLTISPTSISGHDILDHLIFLFFFKLWPSEKKTRNARRDKSWGSKHIREGN